MEPEIFALAILIGIVTGFINTLAGSGSLITLPFLIFLGLPATVANGTNRVSLLVQTFIGGVTLRRQTAMSLKGTAWYLIPSIAGAVVGAMLAAQLQPSVMKTVIGIVMAVMLIPLFLSPKRWLREHSGTTDPKYRWPLVAIFFLIGLYGGFIQAGVGVFLLSALVLLANFSLPHANVIKNFVVFGYTIPVLVIFAWNNQVDWFFGGIMALGQATGAFIAGRFAGKSKRAAVWIHRLLIFMVVASGLKLFGVLDWLFQFFSSSL